MVIAILKAMRAKNRMNTGKMDTITNSDGVHFCYDKSANDNAWRLGEVADWLRQSTGFRKRAAASGTAVSLLPKFRQDACYVTFPRTDSAYLRIMLNSYFFDERMALRCFMPSSEARRLYSSDSTL